VTVPANGASAGIAEGTEAAPDPTPMLIKHVGGSKPKRSFFDYVKICFRAYGASLVESLVGVPIVASAVTLGLYFSQPASGWYPVVFGAIYTYIAWFFIAFILVYFSTFEGGNARSYGLITTRSRQLAARLDDINAQYMNRKSIQLAEYQVEALREANESFADLKSYLNKFPAGLQ
jgi:hypothetical protein